MKKLFLYTVLIAATVASCRKIETDGTTVVNNGGGGGASENTILEGRISANRTLKADYTYKLRGLVYVTNGAILTIEPGTKIVGENGKNGGLIITRSCKIIADGTADKPIIFTSEAANPQRGDWAGLVILGNAPTNASFNGVAGVGEIEGGITTVMDWVYMVHLQRRHKILQTTAVFYVMCVLNMQVMHSCLIKRSTV